MSEAPRKLPPADDPSAASSASPSMYESPSPPSSNSSADFFAAPRPESAVVPLPPDRSRPISPIARPDAWQSSFVPVLPDETTRLIPPSPGSELALSRLDLQRAYAAQHRDRRDGAKDRYVLGCSILLITSVVFVIVVSGLTTMLANSNFPQLEVYSDWPNGGIIPLKYGCHAPAGTPVSIPLHWRNVPRSATNLAVLFANPGSIKKTGIDPVHWFVTDIPLNDARETAIPPNASANPALLPLGAKQRPNAFSKQGAYWPPCVENGTSFFAVHIYAIDASPQVDDFRDAREIMNRFVGVPVARITGVYGKPSKLVIPDKGKGKGVSSWDNDDYQEEDAADDDPDGLAGYHGEQPAQGGKADAHHNKDHDGNAALDHHPVAAGDHHTDDNHDIEQPAGQKEDHNTAQPHH